DAEAGAFTPDGTFYTVINSYQSSVFGSSRTAELATVNLTTGRASLYSLPFNPVSSPIVALQAEASSKLFARDGNGNCYSVDQVTGQFTSKGSIGYAVTDLALDNAGTMWGVAQNYVYNPFTGSYTVQNQLIQINTATGAGTLETTIYGTNGGV